MTTEYDTTTAPESEPTGECDWGDCDYRAKFWRWSFDKSKMLTCKRCGETVPFITDADVDYVLDHANGDCPNQPEVLELRAEIDADEFFGSES